MAVNTYTPSTFLAVVITCSWLAVNSPAVLAQVPPQIPQENFRVGLNPTSVAVADFNRDGGLDWVVTNYDSNDISVRLWDRRRGTFLPPEGGDRFPAGGSPQSVAVGDFDRDPNGFLDLAVANYAEQGTVSILLGNGDGTFGPPQPFQVESYPRFVTAADFDGDGRLDLAVANEGSASVSILLRNPLYPQPMQPLFLEAQRFEVEFLPSSLAVDDFDGNGHPDLAVANAISDPDSGRGSVSILLRNPLYPRPSEPLFLSARHYRVGIEPRAVVTGNFNRGVDNQPDLAVANAGSNNVSILFGVGDGTFQEAIYYDVGERPVALVTKDFDSAGVGPDDLVVINQWSYSATLLLGSEDGTFSWGYPDLGYLFGLFCFPTAAARARPAFDLVLGDNPTDLVVVGLAPELCFGGVAEKGRPNSLALSNNELEPNQGSASVLSGCYPFCQ